MSFVPSYLALHRSGELRRRAGLLEEMLGPCTLCPHLCGNDRRADARARCHAGALPIVSSFTAHFGEEPALVGTRGVGNIFFGNCNLRCIYCQNFTISQNHREERKHEVTCERLAEIMLTLQAQGCHEIGLVSPTHFVPQIVRSVEIAVSGGLHLPLIYNTNAYDAVEVLQLLDGIIDIYLPDLKYSDDAMGLQYSKVQGYWHHARGAIAEMHRQVGSELLLGDDGLVKRGLIIRHLILPNDIAGSREALRWVKSALGDSTTLSIMAQYFPAHRAAQTPLMDRAIRPGEHARVLSLLDALGLAQGWTQDHDAPEYYRPEFENRERPFTGDADNEPGSSPVRMHAQEER